MPPCRTEAPNLAALARDRATVDPAAVPGETQEEQATWKGGPTSIGVLVAIAAAVGALVLVALRLRRRNLGASNDQHEQREP